MDFDKLRQRRRTSLVSMYTLTGGEEGHYVMLGAIAGEVGVDPSELKPVLDYLMGEEFITRRTLSGPFSLTHKGIVAVEKFMEADSRQQKPKTIFSFISNPQLRAVIERDYAELQELEPKNNPKAVLVMSGAVIEGILLDALVVSGKWSFEAGCQQNLGDMLGPAKSKGIIREGRLSEAARDYRKLIHPGREVRDAVVFDDADAKVAAGATDIIIREVKSWHSKQNGSARAANQQPSSPTLKPSSRDTLYLSASQEALEIQITSGHFQNFAIQLRSHADEQFTVAGVSIECDGTQLGQILRPRAEKQWVVDPKGVALIQWPPNQLNVALETMKVKGEYQQEFSASLEFVFQCALEDTRQAFRKRVQVQVDPLNYLVRQF